MKIVIATVLTFLTFFSAFGQAKNSNKKPIYTGYQYQLSTDYYYPIKYTKSFSEKNDIFVTTYTIYHPNKGYAAITVTATHNKTSKKIKVSVDDTNESIFSNINEEETSYDAPSLSPMGFTGSMKDLGGKRIPNQLMLKFNNSLFEFVRVVHILASRKDEDTENSVFLILDEKDKPITIAEQEEIASIKLLAEQQQKEEDAKRIKQQKAEETRKSIAEEKRKSLEAEKLRLFLVERRIKTYDYSELNSTNYDSFKKEIEQKIKTNLNDYKKVNYSAIITVNIDSFSRVTFKVNNLKSDNSAFEDFINSQFKNTKLDNAVKNNYSVSSSFDYSLSIKNSTDTFTFEKTPSELLLLKGNVDKFVECKMSLQNDLTQKSLINGKYVASCSDQKINDYVKESIRFIKFKGSGGGSANFLFSILIPGLGNQFVSNEKNATWLVTTVGVGGLIGGGILMSNLSNSNYQKYKNATTQTDIDNYYNKANLQNHLMLAFFVAGAAWWAIDIIHVCIKGAKNKKRNIETKNKMNLAVYPTYQFNNYALGINVKF